MKIGLGVDTGGTCTDAVLYDMERRKIISSAKTLTTKQDLAIGISAALEQLPPEQLSEVTLVSLSTTLATNACVEDKGGRAKLIFIGGTVRSSPKPETAMVFRLSKSSTYWTAASTRAVK